MGPVLSCGAHGNASPWETNPRAPRNQRQGPGTPWPSQPYLCPCFEHLPPWVAAGSPKEERKENAASPFPLPFSSLFAPPASEDVTVSAPHKWCEILRRWKAVNRTCGPYGPGQLPWPPAAVEQARASSPTKLSTKALARLRLKREGLCLLQCQDGIWVDRPRLLHNQFLCAEQFWLRHAHALPGLAIGMPGMASGLWALPAWLVQASLSLPPSSKCPAPIGNPLYICGMHGMPCVPYLKTIEHSSGPVGAR